MKTDPSIHVFLATGPEAFRVLTGGLTLNGEYLFRSLTLKGIVSFRQACLTGKNWG